MRQQDVNTLSRASSPRTPSSRPCRPLSSSSAAFLRQPPRRRPREAQEACDADDGVAGATRGRDRRLVGPVIPTTAALVVAIAHLLVTLARGGAFAVGGAIHAAPGPGPEAPEDLDGEEIALHQLTMQVNPFIKLWIRAYV